MGAQARQLRSNFVHLMVSTRGHGTTQILASGILVQTMVACFTISSGSISWRTAPCAAVVYEQGRLIVSGLGPGLLNSLKVCQASNYRPCKYAFDLGACRHQQYGEYNDFFASTKHYSAAHFMYLVSITVLGKQ